MTEADRLWDKIQQVGSNHYEGIGEVPTYRETGLPTFKPNDGDTLSLLTRLVNELREENAQLKSMLLLKRDGE